MTLKRKVGAYLPNSLKSALFRVTGFRKNSRALLYKEIIANIEAGEILVSPPGLTGRYWLDARSHLFKRIVLTGSYEPQVTAVLSKNVSGDFIDVGANVGFFAIHIGNQLPEGARVLALEPNRIAFGRLQRNIDGNKLGETVIALDKAASSASKTLMLQSIDGLEEYSSIKDMNHPSVRDRKAVASPIEAVPLDEIVDTHKLSPGLIKIDAEGAELDVLLGMRQVLLQHAPTIVCEINADLTGATAKGISDLFSEHGYKLFSLEGNRTTLDPTKSCEILARRS